MASVTGGRRASEWFVATLHVAVYASLVAVICLVLSEGSGWVIRTASIAADPVALMRVAVDSTVLSDEPPDRAPKDDAGTNERSPAGRSEVFEHARPSPRLFERLSATEAERVKASVSETVVAASSRDWYHGKGQTFRTVCVRLCDGAYFPISFSTTRGRFDHDEAVCKSRCAAPARLFAIPNPGGSPETMRDRDGTSYIALPTAFQFRTGKTPGCSCRPEAWETASIERHRAYAAAEGAPRPVAVAANSSVGDNVVAARQDLPSVAVKRNVLVAIAAISDATPVGSVGVTELKESKQDSSEPQAGTLAADDVAFAVDAVADGKPKRGRNLRNAGRRPRATDEPKTLASLFSSQPEVLQGAQPAADGVTHRAKPNWGRGPNSVLAPRGNSAYDVFARNFY